MCPHYIHQADIWNKSVMPCPRTHLVDLSGSNKDVLDVSMEDFIPMMDQIKWKYLISTDGFSCSNRLVGLVGWLVGLGNQPPTHHYLRPSNALPLDKNLEVFQRLLIAE